ncbi:MAG: phosphate ABC transporter substrate-binding protein [Pseudobdellovibrionaceae bacterium]
MKTLFKITLAAIVGLFSGQMAFADVYVISNSAVNISAGDIKDIFTGEKQSVGGTKLAVADNKAAIGEFTQKALGLDEAKYSATWSKKNFRDGVPLPKAKANDAETFDFVKSTPGGVGYSTSAPPAGITMVKKY